MADLDAAAGVAALGRHPLLEGGLVVLLVGARVEAGEIVDDLLHAASVRIVDVGAQDVVVEEVAVAEHEIGRAHVRTPVTNAHLGCRLLLEKKKTTPIYTTALTIINTT